MSAAAEFRHRHVKNEDANSASPKFPASRSRLDSICERRDIPYLLGTDTDTLDLPRLRKSGLVGLETHGSSNFPKPTGTETILVADDERAIRESLSDFLRTLGYTVLQASSGPDALALVSQHKGTLHLLLTDIMMPMMNGRELSEKLTSEHPELKTIYMSGYTNDEIVWRGLSGISFMQKPFGLATLARKVREVLAATTSPNS